MSGPGENRWRRQGQGNRNSGTNTPTKDNGRQQAMSSLTGNAWGAKQGKAGGAGPTATTAQAQPDNHVPVKDFNANEVKEFLKKKYMESTANQASVYHKVPGDSVSNRSSGAWGKGGTMPHLMPTGQDFFTQLKKQLAKLDQTKPAQ
ncbi:hypothetical protein A1F94_010927 [Pyrenophora tritici-repentis]|uniref:Uncharacterized protein n=2 Tax=Pyrenophora tritici-repentis TaxID=45151 RepID=A0A2W1DAL8_9PLEO|nr:uncharacterized protein PTRG_07501 [Pyrenophora tritici-repentis Pt-1C-BFP]KAF7444917.1 hypothetical protein A1F99_114700 [Pyrenophora tritici-repentis]EDU50420.1 predicted protein [Pyrenophora tritici-repentis Pt-1C-BFP]KAF7564415.1 hypothetical protein PtrM4_038490 [Pyrenophora tritici-repentis]KAG9379158.1 hypothetical protein A1F94_010927 [Pyrenophora tritici-repentis]KAI1511478.1 hypothetical protein Ptr86124_009882 [Pyrenophora tritici-repentis]